MITFRSKIKHLLQPLFPHPAPISRGSHRSSPPNVLTQHSLFNISKPSTSTGIPWKPEASLARERGRLTADLHLSLQTHSPFSSPISVADICCCLPPSLPWSPAITDLPLQPLPAHPVISDPNSSTLSLRSPAVREAGRHVKELYSPSFSPYF